MAVPPLTGASMAGSPESATIQEFAEERELTDKSGEGLQLVRGAAWPPLEYEPMSTKQLHMQRRNLLIWRILCKHTPKIM